MPDQAYGSLWVAREPTAIRRYVSGQLRYARDYGTHGRTVYPLADIGDDDIERVAAAVADQDREFLYARLAVYELIEDPTLITPGRAFALARLLEGDHQDLFAKALDRLGRLDDRYPLLIEALSLARGRGVPQADGLWVVIATSLLSADQAGLGPYPHPDEGLAAVNRAWASAIHDLLEYAAPYIVVDNQHEPEAATADIPDAAPQPGTVYRLAHRTFVEYFRRNPTALAEYRTRQRSAAVALLGYAREVISADPDAVLPTYLARHLSGHVADADLWEDLAATPNVLDCLDAEAVTADAVRTLFGRREIPAPVAGVIGARDALVTAAAADRAGLRQLASTTYGGKHLVGEPSRVWGVAAARAGQFTMHLRFDGHSGSVNKVCTVSLPDGRDAVASGSDDGTIRLWDLQRATPIGAPLTGHQGTVEDVCSFVLPTGEVRLASCGSDRTVRVWDPVAGRTVGPPLTGHTGIVWVVCAVPGADESGTADGRVWLAAAGDDGTVQVWDPVTGEPVGAPLTGHTGPIWGVCAVPAEGGRFWLASGGVDETVRIWDPVTGEPVGPPMAARTGPVRHVCAVPGAGGRFWVAAAGSDGSVQVWDPVTGRPVGSALAGDGGAVRNVCAVPGSDESGRPDGRFWVAAAYSDGSVRLWDPVTSAPVGYPLTGHTGAVLGVCAVTARASEGAEGRVWLATAGGDHTVRVWDPATARAAGQALADRTGPVYGVCGVPGADESGTVDGRVWLASAGADGTVRRWDPVTGRPAGDPLTGHTGAVNGVCAIAGTGESGTVDGRVWLASAGADGTVRRWDPVTGRPAGDPLTGHTGAVNGVCAIAGADETGTLDGRVWLASAGADGTVRRWDPATGLAGGPLTGHTGPVWAVCPVPGADQTGTVDGRAWLASAGADGTVRIWDPVTGRPVGPTLTGHAGSVNAVCAVPGTDASGTPDGRSRLASSGVDSTVRIWDPAVGRSVGDPFIGYKGSIKSVCAIPETDASSDSDVRVRIAGGANSIVLFWDLPSGRPAGQPLKGHTSLVHGMCVIPEPGGTAGPERPAWLITAGDDGTVQIWDAATGSPVGEPLGGPVAAVASLHDLSTPSDPAYCVVRSDGRADIWDPSRADITPLPGLSHVSALTPVTGQPGAATVLAVAGTAGTAMLATPDGTALTEPARIGDGAILALQELPGQPTRIAAADRTGHITIWVPGSSGGGPPPLAGHTGTVRSLCLVPGEDEDPLLASAGDDGTIRLWRLGTWQPYDGPLTGHHGRVWSLTPIPATGHGPGLLASAGADTTVRLWNPETGEPAADPLAGHTDQVRAVITATAPGGRTILVSGSHDGTVRLWHPTTGELIHTIPLGVPVHALLQQQPDERSRQRTDDGASITVGLRTGVLTLDLNQSMFPAI